MRLLDDKTVTLSGAGRGQAHPLPHGKRGFSLVELLVVIAVLATMATITVGGVLRSMKHTREKRIEAMCNALATALVGFQAQEGRWPVKDGYEMKPGTHNGKTIPNDGNSFREEENRNKVVFSGKKNIAIFDPLIFHGSKKNFYISTAELMTKPVTSVNVPNKKHQTSVMSLREAIDGGATSCPLGYADPDDTSQFRYFAVEFNLLTDSVIVRKWQGDDDKYQ